MSPTSEQSRGLKWLWFAAATWLWLVPGVEFSSARAADTNAALDYSSHAFETGDGLPQNSVFSMVQTRDGYLWLGTLNSLSRFDGKRFTVFEESNTPGLNDSRIVHLFEDSQANLWIGTETAGTVVMKEGRITAPGQGELAAGGIERRLIAACEGADGAVWLCLANGEVWRFHHQRFTRLHLPADESGPPRSIIQESNGPVWVTTTRGQYPITTSGAAWIVGARVRANRPDVLVDLLVPSRSGGYWRLANLEIQKWTTNRMERSFGSFPWINSGLGVNAACEDREGNLWVGTDGAGLFRISTDGRVMVLSTKERLSNNTILSLVSDHEGSLWVGTDGGGLNRISRAKSQQFERVEEVQSWVVQSVCEDARGGLWIASHGNGAGYFERGATNHFLPAQGLAGRPRYLKSIFVDREHRVWAGTHGAGLFRLQDGRFQPVLGDGLAAADVQAIFQDRSGVLWFGTAAGLVSWNERAWKRYTTRDGLTSDDITALAEDQAGQLWIGTRHVGLNRRRDGQFTAIRKQDGLPGDAISSLWIDASGVLWVSTFGNGLGRFENGTWTRYTTREGLTSNNLGYIVEDGDGNLWIGSNAGVLRVPKQALNDFAHGLVKSILCHACGKADGLPILECSTGSQPGAGRGRDGRLWFPTIKGLASVDPTLIIPNSNPPPVTIESILIDDKPVAKSPAPGTNAQWVVTLRPSAERLEIQYSSVNLSAPESARFKYRLEGYEKDWTAVGRERVAHYTKLGPGEYTFHVAACNEDGVWNETGSTLAVIVQTPYWKTWWFRSVAALGVLGLIAGIVRYLSTQKLLRQVAVLKQQEALEKERARIARDIHDQVGASLTQVALLGELVESDKDSPADVGAHAQQISQTARETTRALDEIVWTVNPQNDTLEELVNYICKNAQDYLAVAGLRYRLEVPEQLPAVVLKPDVRHNVFLASKESVTNIVRHAGATGAWIRIKLEANHFTVEIEDNGRGIADPDAPSVRNGLRNMRRRLADVGGTCVFARGAEGGALVRLTVPLAPDTLAKPKQAR